MIHHQKHRRMDFVHMMTEYIQTKYTIREKIIENNQNKTLLFRVDDQFDPMTYLIDVMKNAFLRYYYRSKREIVN
jgi:hypothetical protein